MFFTWDWLFKKYPKYKNLYLHMVIAPRNCGKSYDTYKVLQRESLQLHKKALFLRNTDNELKIMKNDFKARFKDKYIVQGNHIFNVEYIKIKNSDNEEIEIPKKKDHVGYFASINTFTNYKSVEAKDINYIFYEEFNEDTSIGKNIYPKFINIFKTFQRFNQVTFLMVGNKDAFDSDFFVNWDIIPSFENEDKVTEILSYDEKRLLGVCYDLCEENFKDLGNDKTLANELAMLDKRTRRYALGFYMKEHNRRVINYKHLKVDFKPSFTLAIDEQRFLFGYNQYKQAILLSPWNWEDDFIVDNLNTYSFDLYSGLLKGAKILDTENQNTLIEFIYKMEKQEGLFYDSYDSRQLIKDLIFMYKRQLQN